MTALRFTDCIDSAELARGHQRVLGIRQEIAESLGRSALEAMDHGEYLTDDGVVDWSAEIKAAEAAKVSIALDASLPDATLRSQDDRHAETLVTNHTGRSPCPGSRRASSLGSQYRKWR
ncbi:hypothetical protein Q31b_33040 [Novipirellula aureliae]|uniref:Uncharacterized protein n=1 Tax=Novipirellula aureliae TaxID=2527966 RepID=A0A5C6DT99_9BACT|nr:hypothetical protein [Novipirellula aureliae]TWU39988.1 hypothetical protein Q31b_33040 [Novipirellula aureliae]